MFGYEEDLQYEIENLKEQLSKMYSKEDMEEMYNYGYNNYLLYSEAINQFKKL